MKYKVGDKVRIKSLDWYNQNKDNHGNVDCGFKLFTSEMSKFCGQVMIITYITNLNVMTMGMGSHYWTDEMIEGLEEETKQDMGEISDGYHTFNELYEYRLLYNASFFNELAKQNLYDVHKSKKHSDGEDCFGGGWFIVMAELPTGQISNHYELKDWNLFQVPEKENANKWDGHTPQDVAKRMREFLTPKPKYPKTYEECCVALEYIPYTDDVIGYKWNILQSLQRLLICRDAYWKIASEEMGLRKPWEPEYKTLVDNTYFTIYTFNGEIVKRATSHRNAILAFPTEEMRDAFYENFKELTEICKELL